MRGEKVVSVKRAWSLYTNAVLKGYVYPGKIRELKTEQFVTKKGNDNIYLPYLLGRREFSLLN